MFTMFIHNGMNSYWSWCYMGWYLHSCAEVCQALRQHAKTVHTFSSGGAGTKDVEWLVSRS